MPANRLLPLILLVGLAVTPGCHGQRSASRSTLPEPVLLLPARPHPPAPVIAQAPARLGTPPYADAGGLPPGVALTGGIRRPWKYVIIHHSASDSGSATEFDRYHRTVRGWDELGYHFVIGNGRGAGDGQIQVGPRWGKQKHGAHCKTPDNRYNDYGIGICLVGNFQSSSRPTTAQMASLERLVRYLTRVCRIPLSSVQTHGGVTHKTECPGRNFPLASLKTRLSSLAAR